MIELEKLEPLSSFAYANWVRYAGFGGDAQAEAIAAIRRGLAAVPKGSDDAAELLEMQIEVARNAGLVGQALSAALEATRTDPERIRAWRQVAELYELTGQRDLAMGNAQNALAHFGGRNLAGTDAIDFAALQAQVARLAPGAAPTPPAAPKAAPGVSATTMPGTQAPAASKQRGKFYDKETAVSLTALGSKAAGSFPAFLRRFHPCPQGWASAGPPAGEQSPRGDLSGRPGTLAPKARHLIKA